MHMCVYMYIYIYNFSECMQVSEYTSTMSPLWKAVMVAIRGAATEVGQRCAS